jgi:cytochrome d ubiquinol oxidase subunit II
MVALWYGILAFMLTTYIALDGRNFGAGILHWVVARNATERRQVIAAIGPLWSWHEVWLVGAGGVMVMAFPRLTAIAFAGYYLALFLILWCLVLRGVSIEAGGHIDDRLWQTFWDAVFVFSNVLLAVLFGAAAGNLVRGAPLKHDGTFHLAFFTNWRVHGNVGLLDWYTLSMALFCVLFLAAHGATYLTMRTEGTVHDRAAVIARRLWITAVPAFLFITLLTWQVRPDLFRGLIVRPLAWVTAMGCGVSVVIVVIGIHSSRERLTLIGSTLMIFGLLMTGAAALFPILLFSTINTTDRLTAFDCAAANRSLWIATGWWFPALVLAVAYLVMIQRHYSGKVNVSRDNQGLY